MTIGKMPGSPAGVGEADRATLRHLRAVVPLRWWFIARFDGERLTVDEGSGGEPDPTFSRLLNGHHLLARRLVTEAEPIIVPDLAQSPLGAMGSLGPGPVAAFVGIPIVRADGSRFGVLVGLDEEPQPCSLLTKEPLFRLLAHMLALTADEQFARVSAERELQRNRLLIDTDGLTGLSNRSGWDRFLAQEDARCARYGDPAGIVVVDLDDLKVVNDRDGHVAGDERLQLSAVAILATARSSDFIARLGGDEFGVVAIHSTPDQVHLLVGRLRTALETAGVAASMGFASYEPVAGLSGAWHRADTAMYLDKRMRRGAAGRR